MAAPDINPGLRPVNPVSETAAAFVYNSAPHFPRIRAVLPLLRALLRIGLLQSGPQILPPSRELAFVVVAAHLALGLLLSLLGEVPQAALLSAVLGTLFMVAVTHGLLMLRGFQARFHQTVTAMAGCELIVGVAALPLSFQSGPVGELSSLLSLVLIGWSLAIWAHIFHHSLEISRFAGFGLSLAYLISSIFIAGLVTVPGA